MNKFWTHPLCHSNISVRIFTSMLVNSMKKLHENIMRQELSCETCVTPKLKPL